VTDFGLRGVLRLDTARDRDDGTFAPWFFAAGVGWAGVRTENMIIAPTLMLRRTSVPELGTTVFYSLPVEWTLDPGLRLGLDAAIGLNLGGVDYECHDQICDSYTRHDVAAEWLLGVRAGWGQRSAALRESRPADGHPPLVILSFDLVAGYIAGAKTWDTYTTGAEIGSLLPYHLRLALRAERPGPDPQMHVETSAPNVVLTGAAGYAVVDRPSVVFAPSLGFSAADKRPIGYMALVLLPVRCKAKNGLEFGAEAGLGRAFGGTKMVDPCVIPGRECGPDMPLVKLDVRSDWAGTIGLYLGYAIPAGA